MYNKLARNGYTERGHNYINEDACLDYFIQTNYIRTIMSKDKYNKSDVITVKNVRNK